MNESSDEYLSAEESSMDEEVNGHPLPQSPSQPPPPPAASSSKKQHSKKRDGCSYSQKNSPKPLTLEQLRKYRHFLKGLSKVRTGKEIRAVFEKLRNSDFNVVCSCMHGFLHDEPMYRGYFTEDQRERVKKLVSPFAKKLKKVTNTTTPISVRKKMLGQKQRGGGSNSTISDVIGALLPMAVEALVAL